MPDEKSGAAPSAPAAGAPPDRRVTEAAQRALAEAALRRASRAPDGARPKETGGPAGPDPVRYGDWERKGIASDF